MENRRYLEDYAYIVEKLKMDPSQKKEFNERCEKLNATLTSIMAEKKRKFYDVIVNIISPTTKSYSMDLLVSLFLKVTMNGRIDKAQIPEVLEEIRKNNNQDFSDADFLKEVYSFFGAAKNLLVVEEDEDDETNKKLQATYIGFLFVESICKNWPNWDNYFTQTAKDDNQTHNQTPLFIPLIEFEEENKEKIFCTLLQSTGIPGFYTFPGLKFSVNKDHEPEIITKLNDMFFEKKPVITTLQRVCSMPDNVDTNIPAVLFRLIFCDNEKNYIKMILNKRSLLMTRSPMQYTISSKIFSFDEILSNRTTENLLGVIAKKVKVYVMFSRLMKELASENKDVDRLLSSWSAKGLPLKELGDVLDINYKIGIISSEINVKEISQTIKELCPDLQ